MKKSIIIYGACTLANLCAAIWTGNTWARLGFASAALLFALCAAAELYRQRKGK